MTLPDDFNPTAHLTDTIQRVYNRAVREWFRDVGAVDWEPDIGTSRASARVACTHEADDSLTMTALRVMLFHFEIRERFSLGETGETTKNPVVLRRSKPQIVLWFQEDVSDIEFGYAPVTGRIAFRLMNESTESITRAALTTYGQRIKTNFGAAGGFLWKKGRDMFTYSDWEKGYQLQLLVRDAAEGRRITEQVLDIQLHTPNWEYANYIKNESPSGAYPTIPGTENIAGEVLRLPRRRPVATVRFQYGAIHIDGLPNNKCLYDRSGQFVNPVVE